MVDRLIILGTGGNAYDVLDIVEAINRVALAWVVAGFLDDARPPGGRYLGLPVLGPINSAHAIEGGHQFINAIGSDRSFARRPQIVASTGLAIERFATLVHPGAAVSSRATVGRGVYIGPGVSVGGAVAVGNHVSIAPNVSVGHDSVIEDYAVLAPGAIVSGSCRIGLCSYVGAGAAIRQRVEIGDGALVGMGSVVLADVGNGTTVAGVPAGLLRPKSAILQPARVQ